MREGCLIGCLGIIAVTMIVAIVLVVVLDGVFGMFRVAPRVDLAEYYGQEHAVTMLLTPDPRFVTGIVADTQDTSSWFVEYVLPHEVVFFADVDRDAEVAKITAAASLKRMAGFMSYYLTGGEGHEIFDNGVITDIGVNSSGVASMKADVPLKSGILGRAKPMAAIAPEAPYTFHGDRFCEVLLNNSGGNAFIALEHLFAGPQYGGETSEGRMVDEEEDALARGISAAHVVFDIVDNDSLKARIRARMVEGADPEALGGLLEEAVRAFASEGDGGAQVEGSMSVEGNELVGEYTLTSVHDHASKNWEKIIEDLEKVTDHKMKPATP